MKKLTAGILAMVLAINTMNISVARAEEANPPLTNDDIGLSDISQETDVSYLQDTTISPVFVETSEQASDYTETILDIPAGEESVTQIYPVTVPQKGAVTFMVMRNNMTTAFSNLTISLYSDISCTEEYGTMAYGNEETLQESELFFQNAGTYYLKVVLDRADNVTDALSFVLGSFFVSNADRDLAEDTLAIAYSDNEHNKIRYKLQVKKTGVMAFAAFPSDYTSTFGGDITIYNAKKQAISVKETISNNKDTSTNAKYARAYYTVQKGTYYIEFSAVASTSHYIVGYSMVNKKDASGASRTKAAKLTIGGKLKSGMVLLSDSVKKTDWYRLTLKEKKKFTILIDAYVSGKLKVEVCDSKGRTIPFGTRTMNKTAQYKMPTKGKWSKGTYYIKVTKENKKASGYYEIKIK